MNITDGDVVCEVTCESQSIDKIALDPVHGYVSLIPTNSYMLMKI